MYPFVATLLNQISLNGGEENCSLPDIRAWFGIMLDFCDTVVLKGLFWHLALLKISLPIPCTIVMHGNRLLLHGNLLPKVLR